MPKPSVYKICDTHEEGKEVYLKSNIRWQRLMKIINVWQIKLFNLSETMAFGVDEIIEILESFGCEKIEKNSGYKSCWQIDIFEVWECGCSKKCVYAVFEEDLKNPEYYNEKANEVMMRVFNETNDYYEREYGIRDELKSVIK